MRPQSLFIILIIVGVVVILLARMRSSGKGGSMEAWDRIKKGALVLDVRTPGEFAAGHLDGALNIPHDEVANRVGELGADKGRDIVVYCKAGGRAGLARNVLLGSGFTNVLNAGGYDQLRASRP